MSYYQHHIFFCLNQRDNGEACCSQHQAQEGFERCKARVKAEKLNRPGGVRVNKAGCLDRCAGGPVAVVYPQGVWYTYVDQHDIDEIVESHLKNGQVVERLRGILVYRLEEREHALIFLSPARNDRLNYINKHFVKPSSRQPKRFKRARFD